MLQSRNLFRWWLSHRAQWNWGWYFHTSEESFLKFPHGIVLQAFIGHIKGGGQGGTVREKSNNFFSYFQGIFNNIPTLSMHNLGTIEIIFWPLWRLQRGHCCCYIQLCAIVVSLLYMLLHIDALSSKVDPFAHLMRERKIPGKYRYLFYRPHCEVAVFPFFTTLRDHCSKTRTNIGKSSGRNLRNWTGFHVLWMTFYLKQICPRNQTE